MKSSNTSIWKPNVWHHGEESVSTFNDPRKKKKNWPFPPTVTHPPGKYSSNELVTQIHDQRVSLTTNVHTCADVGYVEYSEPEDRNCVNHPLFSFHIQITLAKLRYENRFIVYVYVRTTWIMVMNCSEKQTILYDWRVNVCFVAKASLYRQNERKGKNCSLYRAIVSCYEEIKISKSKNCSPL